MIRVNVTFPDGEQREYECEERITPLQIAERHPGHCPYQVLAVSVNHHNRRLDMPLMEDCRIELLDMRSPYGNMSYQCSLSLLYIAAVHDVFGKDVKVTIANSLSQGLFTRIHAGISEETAEQIQ